MAGIGRRLILISLLMSIAEGRFLISDGIDVTEKANCSHQYGFLPCAENGAGYIFMIVVYQVLLYVGDMLIVGGSEVIFYLTGAEFGGIIFRILRALPQMALMILSGIFSDKEHAQSQVSVAVGVYAGITVFTLTVQWCVCVALASKSFKEESHSETCSPMILIDGGVKVDKKTCKTAGFMLLSLIPYALLQLVYAFNTSTGKRIITLIALTISSLSLVSYFAYQIWNPWMQKRSLKYSMVSQVFQGGNNAQIDPGDALKEVKKLLVDYNQEYKIVKWILQIVKWNDKAKYSALDNPSNPKKKLKEMIKNAAKMDKIMSKILKVADGQVMRSEALIKSDREPNIDRIGSLFWEFDTSGDGSLSATELKQLVSKVKFGTHGMKDDDVVEDMLRAFDRNNNGAIDKQEFVEAMVGYLEKAMKAVNTPESSGVLEEFDKMMWKDVPAVVFNKRGLFKSLFRVILGIAMLTFLSQPLMTNILQLSAVINLPSFKISFFFVPIAMNTRAVIAALLPARQKRKDTASLTFSEIYGGAFMNNIVGLTTLLAIVYAKDLTWDYSTEVLTILVVCGVMGTQAFLLKTYHLWTCILPLSLYLFVLFEKF